MVDAAHMLMTVEEFFMWYRNQGQRCALIDGVPVDVA